MRFRHPGASLLIAVLVGTMSACAPDAADVPQGGSQLDPSFRPQQQDADARGGKGDRRKDRTETVPAGSRPSPTAGGGSDDSGSGGSGAGSPSPDAQPTSGATSPGGTPTARAALTDDRDDVSGLGGAPAYVDLTGATLTRDGDRYRLVVETDGNLPQEQDGDDTMNVVGFVDNDLDGTVDHEVWATLADNGWGSSSRHPDGARFGDDSGVRVTVSGSTITLTFAASVIGGTPRFQWSVASEHGTLEQVASGTTAQDYGPDDGAVRFPG